MFSCNLTLLTKTFVDEGQIESKISSHNTIFKITLFFWTYLLAPRKTSGITITHVQASCRYPTTKSYGHNTWFAWDLNPGPRDGRRRQKPQSYVRPREKYSFIVNDWPICLLSVAAEASENDLPLQVRWIRSSGRTGKSWNFKHNPVNKFCVNSRYLK